MVTHTDVDFPDQGVVNAHTPDGQRGTLVRFPGKFARVTDCVITRTSLTLCARMLFTNLCRVANRSTGLSYYSNPRHAEDLGVALRNVERAFRDLHADGWVVTKHRRNATAVRRVVWDPEEAAELRRDPQARLAAERELADAPMSPG